MCGPAVTGREQLARSAHLVAPGLLGAIVVSRLAGALVRVRITEVEAYGGIGEDPGSHAYRRMSARNAAMFGPPGHAYVYFTYGMHWCLNIVTGPNGQAGAVLLRAGEVIDGHEVARARRPSAKRDQDLARGPARLTAALGVSGAQDGVDVLAGSAELVLLQPSGPPASYERGPRTGVAGEGALTPWRYFLPGEPSVSPYRAAVRRARG